MASEVDYAENANDPISQNRVEYDGRREGEADGALDEEEVTESMFGKKKMYSDAMLDENLFGNDGGNHCAVVS